MRTFLIKKKKKEKCNGLISLPNRKGEQKTKKKVLLKGSHPQYFIILIKTTIHSGTQF